MLPFLDLSDSNPVLSEEVPTPQHLMRDHIYVMSRSFRAGLDSFGRLIVPQPFSGIVRIHCPSILPEEQEVRGFLTGLYDAWIFSGSSQLQKIAGDHLSCINLEHDLILHHKNSTDFCFHPSDRDDLISSYIDRFEKEGREYSSKINYVFHVGGSCNLCGVIGLLKMRRR